MKFKIDHDLHIHSFVSACSTDPEHLPAKILAYAKKNNFTNICLTDHFWDSAIPGASEWYKPQNYEHIIQSLPLPQDKDVKFRFGCETEMNKTKKIAISREVMDKLDFFIVPTNHFHMTGFTIEEEIKDPAGRAKAFMEHNHALLDMDLPFHKMGIAHFTCQTLAYYSNGTLSDVINSISDSEFFEFFERAAKCGIGIELNVHLEHASMPEIMRPYKIARQCGCKFYLGSDAHVGKELDEAPARFAAVVDALELTEDDKYRIP